MRVEVFAFTKMTKKKVSGKDRDILYLNKTIDALQTCNKTQRELIAMLEDKLGIKKTEPKKDIFRSYIT